MTPPSSPQHSLDDALSALHQSEQQLLRTVDSLRPDDYREPSVLPGWSRAHVIAHLALNAEGLARAVDGIAHGNDVAIYESDARRDADIEELAQAEPAEIRERLFGAGQTLRDALALLGHDQWAGNILRLPDGPRWPLATVPDTRRREVEIHHADLDAGYGPGEWPEDFRVALLDLVTSDRASDPDSPTFAVRATDTVRTWSAGAEQPVVEGSAAALGWWLVGRGSGEGLACNAGELPRLGPWRRIPVK